jgi:lytic murein transglycosylase
MKYGVSKTMAAAGMLAASILLPGAAHAATACRNTGDFNGWMKTFRQEATQAGIPARVIASALDGVTLDDGIIRRDRGQGFFTQSFQAFYGTLATTNRVQSGKAAIAKHRAIFDRVEKEFGVPPAVIAALWALESDFGSGMGNLPVLRSLATLAYDCRRGDMFRVELMEALRIIEKGDLKPADMIGSWAGELGQTQFLPRHYNTYGLDYDGDGRRDLFRSVPDIIATSANYVKGIGWKAGQPWLDEVRVPEKLDWAQADLNIQHPRSQWVKWGVTLANGQPLPDDMLPASLHLLMSRNGPAFLVYPNFRVYMEWNKSLNYSTTAAHLANRINGGPALGQGRAPVQVLEPLVMKELQAQLVKRGAKDVEIDGRIGTATRAAIRAQQIRLALPADTYPSIELLEKLRAGK